METPTEQIKKLLVYHLGSENAAEVWLNSYETGYSKTALDCILSGHGSYVLDDLKNRFGPSPHYS